MSIVLNILKQSGRLEAYEQDIRAAFEEAVEKIKAKIDIPNVDVVIADSPRRAIPETGIGGEAHSAHFVVISVNPDFPNLIEVLEQEIQSTLAHELSHCARMKKVSSWKNLFEALITEGLADRFDIEINNTKPKPWSIAVSGKKLEEMKKRAEKEFQNDSYDHISWFFGSNKENVPRWTGYSLGFDIVGKYMEKTGKKPSEIMTLEASDFITIN